MVRKHFVLSNMAHLSVFERQGPFKGHSRKKKTYCSVKIGCPLSGSCTEYWVTSCWLMLKSSAGYLKGAQSLDHCQYGCSCTANICSFITTDTLDTEFHFPKIHSLNFVHSMNICYVIGSWATCVRTTLKRYSENEFLFWKRESLRVKFVYVYYLTATWWN